MAYDEDKAFERVMQACRAAEAKGWTIQGGRFFDRAQKFCCPVGAFIIETTGRDAVRAGYHIDFAVATGLSSSSVGKFITEVDFPRGVRSRSRGARLARRVFAALRDRA